MIGLLVCSDFAEPQLFLGVKNMFYQIIDTMNEMQEELMSDGVKLAKKPSVERNTDGNVVISIDYLLNGEEWEFSTEIEEVIYAE